MVVHVDWSEKMLKKYDHGNSKNVYDIFRGDEQYIYAYKPESKYDYFQDKPNPLKVLFREFGSEAFESEF